MFLFLFFKTIDIYFLVTVVIAKTFNPIAELVIPIAIPNKKAKTVTVEAK